MFYGDEADIRLQALSTKRQGFFFLLPSPYCLVPNVYLEV